MARFLERRDEAAFRALYRRFTPVLYLLARRLLGPARDHADDVVQETWIRACTALPGFQWQSSLQTWLCGIAVNCSRETLRRASPPEAGDDEQPGNIASHNTAPVNIDLEDRIAQLPRTCRHVFLLHDVYGYTHAEIGALLEIEAGTSKHHLFRARRSLRAGLAARSARGESDD